MDEQQQARLNPFFVPSPTSSPNVEAKQQPVSTEIAQASPPTQIKPDHVVAVSASQKTPGKPTSTEQQSELQKELARLQLEFKDEQEFYTNKVAQLKRQLLRAEQQAEDAVQEQKQSEQQRQKLERLLMQGLSGGTTPQELS